MHTVKILGTAFGLLALCFVAARWLRVKGSPVAAGALWFIPLWFVGAAINMYIGVSQAGYSVAEELPMFLFVFGFPASVAALLWWRKK